MPTLGGTAITVTFFVAAAFIAKSRQMWNTGERFAPIVQAIIGLVATVSAAIVGSLLATGT
jgi:hypothetical protein